MLKNLTIPNALAALLFIYLVGDKAMHMVLGMRGPYVINSSEVTNSPLHEGDMLLVRQDFDHVRLCRTTLNLFVTRVSDGKVLVRQSVMGGAAPLGNNRVVVIPVQLPEKMDPGAYTFRSTADTSGEGCDFQIEAKETPFQIVNKPEN